MRPLYRNLMISVVLFASGLAFSSEGILPTASHWEAQQQDPAPNPSDLLRTARTVHISDRQSFPKFPAEPLEKKLFEEPEFRTGALVIVKDLQAADLLIELEHQGAFDYTFRMSHRATGVVLGSGKVIAWDGIRAAPGIAKQIIRVRRRADADFVIHRAESLLVGGEATDATFRQVLYQNQRRIAQKGKGQALTTERPPLRVVDFPSSGDESLTRRNRRVPDIHIVGPLARQNSYCR